MVTSAPWGRLPEFASPVGGTLWTSCDSAGGSSVPEGQLGLGCHGAIFDAWWLFQNCDFLQSKQYFVYFHVSQQVPTPRHDCLDGQMKTDMNGPEISWRLLALGARQPQPLCGFPAKLLHPWRTSSLPSWAKRTAFEFASVRFLVRGWVLHTWWQTEQGPAIARLSFAPLFFSLGVGVPFVQRAVSWRRSPWWTGSSSRFGLSSEAHGSAEESQCRKDAEQTNWAGRYDDLEISLASWGWYRIYITFFNEFVWNMTTSSVCLYYCSKTTKDSNGSGWSLWPTPALKRTNQKWFMWRISTEDTNRLSVRLTATCAWMIFWFDYAEKHSVTTEIAPAPFSWRTLLSSSP